MTRSILSAIRAIVAVHAKFNRDRLLGAIDAAIDRERARQPEVTPMQFEEEESMMGAQIKTTPGGGAGNADTPRGPRHQRTG